MSDRASLGEMLTYGVRTLFWRPVHAAILVIVGSLAVIAYYTWAQSPGGQEFMLGYATATMDPANFNIGAYFSYMGLMALGGLLVGSVMYAGIYRLLVRDKPNAILPFQVGRDELNMLIALIVLTLSIIGVLLVAMLAAFILIFVLSLLVVAVVGDNPAAANLVGGVMGFLAIILIFVPVCYVIGRLSVSLPLSIKQRRFSFGGWSASKRQGAALLGAHILIFILMLVIQFALSWELMAASFQTGLQGGMQSPEDLAALMANPFGNLLYIAAPIYMVMYIVMLGPTAAVAAKAAPAD